MFAIIAALLFILAAFRVDMEAFELVPMGLCSLAIHLLVGAWPFGSIKLVRRQN